MSPIYEDELLEMRNMKEHTAEVRAHPRRGTRGVRSYERRVAGMTNSELLDERNFYGARASAATNRVDRDIYEEKLHILTKEAKQRGF